MRKMLLTVLLLAACGGGDGPTSPVTPDPPRKPDPDPEPVPLVVTMTAELYQTLENGDCEHDVTITATGDGTATWTGLGFRWYIEGGPFDDARDAQWVADWLDATGVSRTAPAEGAIITLPDSTRITLHYTAAGRTDSVSFLLRCAA